jgi:hypothetical protein
MLVPVSAPICIKFTIMHINGAPDLQWALPLMCYSFEHKAFTTRKRNSIFPKITP